MVEKELFVMRSRNKEECKSLVMQELNQHLHYPTLSSSICEFQKSELAQLFYLIPTLPIRSAELLLCVHQPIRDQQEIVRVISFIPKGVGLMIAPITIPNSSLAKQPLALSQSEKCIETIHTGGALAPSVRLLDSP